MGFLKQNLPAFEERWNAKRKAAILIWLNFEGRNNISLHLECKLNIVIAEEKLDCILYTQEKRQAINPKLMKIVDFEFQKWASRHLVSIETFSGVFSEYS